MADHYESIGQSQTEAWVHSNGRIIIQQWDQNDQTYHAVRFDPLFVPTLIKWLFEFIAPEAVG